MEKSDVEYLVAFLQELLCGADVSDMNTELLSAEAQMLGKGMNLLNAYIKEFKAFSTDLARGELNTKMPSRDNQFCWPLKALQANLTHLTWQAQQVAKGDYSQRVAFLGDFSDAFNVMIDRLQQREEQYQKQTTEAAQKASELHDMAFRDHETKLFNRRYCMQLLKEWTEHHYSFSICFLDLDGLKQVNDQFGHLEGDYYITSFADVLKNTFRSADSICRIGGDEFVVLMQDAPEKIAKARIEEVMERFRVRGQERGLYEMAFSYGVKAVDDNNTKSPLELLDEADSLMYKVKKTRKKATVQSVPGCYGGRNDQK